jgi:flagellar hook assembly protein FlgD
MPRLGLGRKATIASNAGARSGSLDRSAAANAAGRLVRQLASGSAMAPGANVVRWDGRDRDGRIASPGIYLVHVDALGQRRTATLAVAR